MKKQRHTRVKAKIGVAKGFGPRHAENAAEGEPVDLTKVPSDTVQALLTPREAVLNRNAAELAGRGNIEALNEDGNELARKGVDLAARGLSSVPAVKVPVPRVTETSNVLKYVLPGEIRREAAAQIPKLAVAEGDDDVPANAWGEGSSLKDRWAQDFGRSMKEPFRPEVNAYHDLMHFLSQFGAPTEPKASGLGPGISNEEMMRRYPGLQLAGGTSDMKTKPKQSKPAPISTSGVVPPEPMSGSPYAQGFQKMQGYARGAGVVPGRGNFNPAADVGGYYGNRGIRPAGASVNQNPDIAPSFYGTSVNQNPDIMPAGNPGWQAAGMTSGGGGFYPPGRGMFAGGSAEVPGEIGAPNPSKAYDTQGQVDFKAPDISGFLKAIHDEAKKQGISQGQMAQIAQQIGGGFGGGGGGGGGLAGNYAAAGSPTPVYGASGYPSAIPVGGYQGGISDIGYPPFIMPNAEYHADKGSTWEGAYDPAFLVQRYQGGSNDVGFYGRWHE